MKSWFTAPGLDEKGSEGRVKLGDQGETGCSRSFRFQ